jgi:Alginate export
VDSERRTRPFTQALIVIVHILADANGTFAQSQSACRPAYQSLRFDEDWSCLRDPNQRQEPWDSAKYIELGDERYLSLGADARWRYERFVHPGFGAGPEDGSGYALQRYLFHSDIHLSESLRAFAEVQSSWVAGRVGGPRRSDLNRIDLHQAFVDVRVHPTRDTTVTFRAGRQEVEFGSSRLVSTRDGFNVRLSFDGLRVMARTNRARVWGFVMQPVEIDPGPFDDGRERRTLWGVSAGNAPQPRAAGNLAVYLSGLHARNARYDQGSGSERRITLGGRAWGAGERWDYNIEPILQWGRFGSGRIRAWALASDVGLSWREHPLSPRFGLRADITSGDRDREAVSLETFNPLFAGGPYSGFAGLVGPSNIWDVTPHLSVRVATLTVATGCAVFSRTSRSDGIYGINLNLERTGRMSRALHVGVQPTVQATWFPSRHVTAVITATFFNVGRFLVETPPGENVGYTTAFVAYRF